MKVLVGTFNKEKVLVGAFSGHCEFREGSLAALIVIVLEKLGRGVAGGGDSWSAASQWPR